MTAVPAWAARALADVPVHEDVEVGGRRVHVRRWGSAGGARDVVLVHGGAAHGGWWDHVAPLLAERRRVVAVDLGGHGDSAHADLDRGEDYGMSRWAREVVEAAALDQPFVVGHSMGGWVALTAAAEMPDAVGGLVVIDSPLLEQPPEEERLRHRRRPTRVYPEREQALARFSTIPPQDVVLPWVRDHVAGQSLRPVEGGWTWKFDPMLFGLRANLRDLLPHLRCPTALLRCEHGLLSQAMTDEMVGLLQAPAAVVELPDTGHHPMLDQPLMLAAVLRTLLAGWEPHGPA